MIKTYGHLSYDKIGNRWVLADVKPHVSIKLKSIFETIPKHETPPYHFTNLPGNCNDLIWFTQRYPFDISKEDLLYLKSNKTLFDNWQDENEKILAADYIPRGVQLRDGEKARHYQGVGADFLYNVHGALLGDDIGLGKTLTAILMLLNPNTLPALVVVQTHLTLQWKDEIERFTNLGVHIIKGTKPYTLPVADVYIIKYSCITGWVNVFSTGFIKAMILDEVQELRHSESAKYYSVGKIAQSIETGNNVGLSATPIYNYGEEIFNIMNILKKGAMGTKDDFLREWTGYGKIVKHPEALGAFLRDNFLFLRRTRTEVGRELPAVNKIVYTVDYDENEVRGIEELSKTLAIRVISGSFMERGQAARELDLMMRQVTGVAKAKQVAAYVKMFLDNKEPVVLVGWHRAVYDIWLKELAEFNPAMYTGSESEVQKNESKRRFIEGETDLFILSLRSGVGLNGLQNRCNLIVFGEFDWSPKVQDQVIGRVDRDRAEEQQQVTAIFLKCDFGSDPLIIDLLGLKASQAHAIVDPMIAAPSNISDESRIKMLAENILKKKNHEN